MNKTFMITLSLLILLLPFVVADAEQYLVGGVTRDNSYAGSTSTTGHSTNDPSMKNTHLADGDGDEYLEVYFGSMEFFLSGDTMDNPIEIIAELFGSLEDAGAKFWLYAIGIVVVIIGIVIYVLWAE